MQPKLNAQFYFRNASLAAFQIASKASVHVSHNLKIKDTTCFFCYVFSIAALFVFSFGDVTEQFKQVSNCFICRALCIVDRVIAYASIA